MIKGIEGKWGIREEEVGHRHGLASDEAMTKARKCVNKRQKTKRFRAISKNSAKTGVPKNK